MMVSVNSLYENNSKEIRRFVKFAVVGAIGAIIDFTLLNILHGYIGWGLFWANTISVSAAIFSNFIWNRYWTYPESRSRKKRTQLPQFTLINLVGLLINNFIVIYLAGFLLPITGEPLNYNIAKLVAIGVVLFWNFGINRIWTYRGL